MILTGELVNPWLSCMYLVFMNLRYSSMNYCVKVINS